VSAVVLYQGGSHHGSDRATFQVYVPPGDKDVTYPRPLWKEAALALWE
jgi:hypothetical protein